MKVLQITKARTAIGPRKAIIGYLHKGFEINVSGQICNLMCIVSVQQPRCDRFKCALRGKYRNFHMFIICVNVTHTFFAFKKEIIYQYIMLNEMNQVLERKMLNNIIYMNEILNSQKQGMGAGRRGYGRWWLKHTKFQSGGISFSDLLHSLVAMIT